MWSLWILIGLPIIGIILTVLITVVVLTKRRGWTGSYGLDDAGLLGLTSLGAIILLIIVTTCVYFPYEKEYHYWDRKEGTVEEINKRLIGSGDGMEEKFVVRFSGYRQEYGCEDTRCALVAPGDYLALSCIRIWQYSGTDGWDCNFIESRDSSGDSPPSSS